jgi:hypothetical protein
VLVIDAEGERRRLMAEPVTGHPLDCGRRA